MSAPGPSDRTTPAVVVAYREAVGLATWRRRHAESPVPSVWPYGLDKLGEFAHPVVTQDVPPLTGVRARLAGLTGVRRPKIGADAAEAAVAWEEMTAVDMLTTIPARRYYAGVIWATDAIAAGEETPRLTLVAKTLRQLDGLWVLSRPQAEAVRDWLGPNCPPVHFLRFGVDPDFYFSRPYPSVPHVVSVGGDRDRDPKTLYAALEIVHAARPDAKITVQSKADLPAPAGVEKFERLPHVEVSELLGTASVVALATRANLHASGMTVGLEAQSVGRPVVVCDTPGMRDYFVDDVTGALVPVADPERMAAEIIALLDDPARAEQLGRAGREHVLAHHTTTTMGAELAEIAAGQHVAEA
ncbi:MAG TPA: glycosyltransferase family 4 protein [Propionibacteriaceae bacterium]